MTSEAQAAYARSWRLAHPERVKKQKMENYWKHHDEIRARRKAHYWENRDELVAKTQEYKKAHRKELAAASREYYAAHREEQQPRHLIYSRTHREEASERQKKWIIAHPDTYAIHGAKRKALKLNAPGSGITANEWKELKVEHGQRCAYCNEIKPLTMDHIVPLINGGAHDVSNIVPACRSCNSSKRQTPLLVWMFRQKIAPIVLGGVL
jgi:5-methylcytosine-specific restriction endonuclease McrA